MNKICFSVGEPSGDEHAAHLIKALLRRAPNIELRGMGGRNMRAAGVALEVDAEKSGSLMGFHEVLLSAGSVLHTWRTMTNLLHSWRPDILVIVDYPDFNLRLAKVAHSLGIKVFYYITPQLWAWRTSRAKLIDHVVDRAAVIFPFERNFFEQHGFHRSVFVGHPFCETIVRFTDKDAESSYRNLFLLSQNLDPKRPVLALLPGSRSGEIKRHLPGILEGAVRVKAAHPEVQPLIAVAPAIEQLVRESARALGAEFPLISNKSLDILRCADAGMLKSGTSNLQAAFYGLPIAMCYRTSALSAFIAHRMIHLKEFSIVNVIRSGTIPEILQEEATPENLSKAMSSLLFDSALRENIKAGLQQVVQALQSFDKHPAFKGTNSQAERTAALVQELL